MGIGNIDGFSALVQFIESFNMPMQIVQIINDFEIPCLLIVKPRMILFYVDCDNLHYLKNLSKIHKQYADDKLIFVSKLDWLKNSEFVKSELRRLINKGVIHERVKKLTVQELSKSDVKSFNTENGLKPLHNSDHYIALCSEDCSIVAIAMFSMLDNDVSYLDQLVYRLNTRISGGLKKILQYFSRTYQISKIVYKSTIFDYNLEELTSFGFQRLDNCDFCCVDLSLDTLSVFPTKTCVLCGKKFIPKLSAQRVCYDTHYRSCAFCGKLFEISRPTDSKNCCSVECTVKLRERTTFNRFGVTQVFKRKDFVERRANTVMERFGCSSVMKNPEIAAKMRATTRERYGVDYASQSDIVKERMKSTCLERYGVPYSAQIPSRIEKAKLTTLQRYGSTYPIGNEEIHKKAINTTMERYGVPYYCMSEDYRLHTGNIVSKRNLHIISMLSDIGIDAVPEKVTIDRYSYDIYIPSSNTVIEVNPTITHNSFNNPWSNSGLNVSYHVDKTNLARNHGYNCVNIWDWDVDCKVVNLFKNRLPIYARNCKIVELSAAHASKFENIYHLQGSVRSQSVCIGLEYNGDLVQVMTFGKPRYSKHYEWELLRLCSSDSFRVIGGASKLWKYFIYTYSPKSVISYCDLSKFSGQVYDKLDMKLNHISKPNKVWSKHSDVVTNNLLMQRGYDQLFGTNFGKGTSNEQLMLDSGWLPVYDCGQAVYDYVRDINI